MTHLTARSETMPDKKETTTAQLLHKFYKELISEGFEPDQAYSFVAEYASQRFSVDTFSLELGEM